MGGFLLEASGNTVSIVALVLGFLLGFLLIAGMVVSHVGTVEKASVDCLPVCVIDGVQYQPAMNATGCWCDTRYARGLTD